MHDPTMLENEIIALRFQIRQATTVLTHVVQTMSVPSPAALINVMDQDTSVRDRQPPMQGRQPHLNGCSCAILYTRDDGKFGTGREIAFLAACYCPDPWEFQERVLRQIDSMQKDIQTLRQELLEIERRATISLRQEVLEWEKMRDKEWAELNERLQRTLLISESEERLNSRELRNAHSPYEKHNEGTSAGSPISVYIEEGDTETQDRGAMDQGCKEKGKSTCQIEAERGGQGAGPTVEQLPDHDNDDNGDNAIGHQGAGRWLQARPGSPLN